MSFIETARCREVALPPDWAPYAVARDTGGTLWTTILAPPGLARMLSAGAPADGESTVEFGHEALPGSTGHPMLLAATADGALWCTWSDDRLSRRDASGDHTVIDLVPGSAPYGIAAASNGLAAAPDGFAAASDGGVWFTAPGRNQVGRATAAGDVTMVDLPVAEARAAMLTVDAKGSAWVALNGAGALARVSGGTVRIVELPAGSTPVGVAASTTGVWYADIAGGRVGRVDPSGSIEQIEFADAACRPHAVAADPDGGCWATLWGSSELARITADGDVTLRRLPGREPHGLWVDDSLVWVAMESGSLAAVEKSEFV